MIELKLSEKDARSLHATGSKELQTVLESSAPEGFFKQTILDRITSVEALFAEMGKDYEQFKQQTSFLRKQTVAYEILVMLCEVLNEGWIPNYNDYEEQKWWLWYYLDKPGFRLDLANYDLDNSFAGSRLVLKSKERALHIDKYFKHVLLDFFSY